MKIAGQLEPMYDEYALKSWDKSCLDSFHWCVEHVALYRKTICQLVTDYDSNCSELFLSRYKNVFILNESCVAVFSLEWLRMSAKYRPNREWTRVDESGTLKQSTNGRPRCFVWLKMSCYYNSIVLFQAQPNVCAQWKLVTTCSSTLQSW